MTGVKVTAWETNKKNTDHGNTFDDDFDDDYAPDYAGNYREDTETHPALQMFPNYANGPKHGKFNSASNAVANIKQKLGYHKQANSYAGFLLDNNWNRKLSKSREKKSTDGMISNIP